MALVPQVIPLTGSTASGVAIDSTGDNYDGESRLSWPFSSPAPYTQGKLVAGDDPTQTDADVTFELRDFNAGSVIVATSQVSVGATQEIATFDPDQIDGTADIGLRADIANPSATGGATTDIGAAVVLKP